MTSPHAKKAKKAKRPNKAKQGSKQDTARNKPEEGRPKEAKKGPKRWKVLLGLIALPVLMPQRLLWLLWLVQRPLMAGHLKSTLLNCFTLPNKLECLYLKKFNRLAQFASMARVGIKLFTSLIYRCLLKAREFIPCKPFWHILKLVSKAGTYPTGKCQQPAIGGCKNIGS